MGGEFTQAFDPDEGLAYIADRTRHAELLMEKWSKRPTIDRRTGKVEMVDWLGTDHVGRWKVDKLETDDHKLAMAMLLENQSRSGFGGALTQASHPTQVGDLVTPALYALPIIRRVYAQIMRISWAATVPMQGPLAFLFFLDYLRADSSNNQNTLSVEYNYALTPENGVPKSGKLVLTRAQLTAVKNILGVTWSHESQEDMQAQLGQDVERLLVEHFSGELARDILARGLIAIRTAAVTGTATGTSLIAPWAGPNTQHQFGAIGSLTVTDYKQSVYSTLVNADVDFQRANRMPSDAIVAGYGLAGYLQKINTATQSQAPDSANQSSLGITDYGTFAGRWRIWGTDLIKDDAGLMYKADADSIMAGAVFAPYVPIQVMPAIYAEYDTTSGALLNTDKFTRNIRERSAFTVTKPYAFQPLLGPATGLNQY